MAVTLTQAARSTKLITKVALAMTLLFLVFKVSSDIYRAVFPKREKEVAQLPDFAFGKLPPLQIETITLAQSPTETPLFVLDLVTTALPETPDRVSVFPVLKAPYGFLALDRAKELARKLNFTSEPQALTPTYYLWSDTYRKLEMDTQSLNFSYEYNYLSDPSVFVLGQFLSLEAGTQSAVDLLKSKNLLGGGTAFGGARGQDLSEGERRTKLLTFKNRELTQTTSLARATAVRVEFFRTPINEIPLVSPQFKKSLVSLLISGQRDNPGQKRFTQILKLDYTYWVVNRSESATYPVIPAQSAWQKLQNDPAFFVYLEGVAQRSVSSSLKSFTVNNIYLAYYDSAQYQPYLQPVWVFAGKAVLSSDKQAVEAAAYVPAIPVEWTTESTDQ